MFYLRLVLDFVPNLLESRGSGRVGEDTGSAPEAILVENFERSLETQGNHGLDLWMKLFYLDPLTNTFSSALSEKISRPKEPARPTLYHSHLPHCHLILEGRAPT